MEYLHTFWPTLDLNLWSKLFTTLILFHGGRKLTTTACCSQINGQFECFSCIKVAIVRFHLSDFSGGLTYVHADAYNCLQYSDIQSHRKFTISNRLAHWAATCHEIWSCSWNCLQYAERRPIATQDPETALKRGAHKGNSRVMHWGETGEM